MNGQALIEVYSSDKRSFLWFSRWIHLERETKVFLTFAVAHYFCALVALALRGEDTFLRKTTPYS